jgi:hypothetical protein
MVVKDTQLGFKTTGTYFDNCILNNTVYNTNDPETFPSEYRSFDRPGILLFCSTMNSLQNHV